VEDRKQRLKFKVLQNNNPAEDPVTTYLNMLKLQNTKADKIIKGYGTYMSLREKAATEGVSFEELKEAAIADGAFASKKKKVLKKKKAAV